jgi:serine-type D-Ala-D-Ala carboxypeptidase (penicillin-binding protein 5/6)
MKQEAQRLQALDTVPRSPNGLDEDGQRSSAYDLALIAREGLTDVAFARYARTTTAEFPGRSYSGDRRATYQIQTQNPLLLRGYDGALGVKTGFTTQAGRTFIGAAERDGRTLIVTMMGIGERTGDAASRLLDWGFANAERIDRPVGELVEPVAARSAPIASEGDDSDGAASGGGPADVEGGDAVAAAGESVGGNGPSRVAQGLTALAVLLGLVLITTAVLSSDPVVRRRIRRRYR